MSMPSWYTIIYTSLIFVSIVLYIVSFVTTGTAKLASSISAYSTIAASVLMILGYSLNNVSKIYQNTQTSNWEYFKLVISNTGPFILLLGIIGYSLYLLITYQNRITQNHVTAEYTTFSSISIILMLIEIYIFYNGMNSKLFTNTGKMSKVTYSIMYLVGVLNLISVLIIGTILKYFTTDG